MARDWWQHLQRYPRMVDVALASVLFGLALLASTLDTGGHSPEFVRPVPLQSFPSPRSHLSRCCGTVTTLAVCKW